MPASTRPNGAAAAGRAGPLRRCHLTISPMPLDRLLDRAMQLAHRLAGLAALYLIEDPAMMALIFC